MGVLVDEGNRKLTGGKQSRCSLNSASDQFSLARYDFMPGAVACGHVILADEPADPIAHTLWALGLSFFGL